MQFAFNWHSYHIGPKTDRAKLYSYRFLSYFQTDQVTSLLKMCSKYMQYIWLPYICVYCFDKSFWCSLHFEMFIYYRVFLLRWRLLSLYLTLNILFQKVQNDDQFSYPRNDYLSDYHWIGISSQNAVTLVVFFYISYFLSHVFLGRTIVGGGSMYSVLWRRTYYDIRDAKVVMFH